MQINTANIFNITPSKINTDENSQDKKENQKQGQMVNGVELSESEIRLLRELQSTDREVKAHEAAHQAAGGGFTGAASYSYTKGPDNQMYATAGEVPIRMQEGNTPQETISNARQIIAAAMAPANPSPQDYKVAAGALQMETRARAELMKIKAQENKENSNNTNNENEKNNKISNAYKEQNNTLGNNFDIAS